MEGILTVMTKNIGALCSEKLENRMSLINIYFHPKLHHEFYLKCSCQAVYVKDEVITVLGLLDHGFAITIIQLFSAAGRQPEMAH